MLPFFIFPMIELNMRDEVIKMTPPAVISGVTIMGLPLHEWVYVMTIVYTIVGIVCLIKKTFFPTTKEIIKDDK